MVTCLDIKHQIFDSSVRTFPRVSLKASSFTLIINLCLCW